MKLFKKILIVFIFFNLGLINFSNAKPIPDSFADLAERLINERLKTKKVNNIFLNNFI